MPSANRETLTTRLVEALPASNREIVVWDRELPGFGLRVHPSGSKVYMVHKRSGGKSRRVTIGRHGVWSLDAARREAGGIIASLKKGEVPARPGAENGSANGPTIAELAEQYMTEHVAVRCKPTTARSCRHIFDKYLLPQFGRKRLGEITPEQVAALHYGLREKATTANQANRAALPPVPQGREIGLRSGGWKSLPVHQEVSRRGAASASCRSRNSCDWAPCLMSSRRMGKISTTAAAGLRLLMLTGCRRNEILMLRWEDVDLEHDEIRLRDAKTGARAVPLSPTARQVLVSLPRQPDNPWVISGRRPGARLSNLNATVGGRSQERRA